jgi:SAM-dependent methyltransferase
MTAETLGPPADPSRLADLIARCSANVAGAMITVIASLGDRLGLFRALAKGPATSAELAGRTGLHERYVREWLGAMYAADYIAYTADTGRYHLTAEQARVFAEEGGPVFMGGTLEITAALATIAPAVAQSFHEGGGLSQSAYPIERWEGMERDHAVWVEHLLVATVLNDVPEVAELLRRGAACADIGCGHGGALIKLAGEFPSAHWAGYDVFAPVVQEAQARAAAAGVDGRVSFAVLDAAAGLPGTYDLITTFDVVHDAADPPGLLRAIHDGLRPDGVYLCYEPASAERPEDRTGLRAAYRYGTSLLYCMTTSLGQGGLALGAMGLPEPVLRELVGSAGFTSCRRVPLRDVFGQPDPHHALYAIRH